MAGFRNLPPCAGKRRRDGGPCGAKALPGRAFCKTHGGTKPVKHGQETQAAKSERKAARVAVREWKLKYAATVVLFDAEDEAAFAAITAQREAEGEGRNLLLSCLDRARLDRRRIDVAYAEGRIDLDKRTELLRSVSADEGRWAAELARLDAVKAAQGETPEAVSIEVRIGGDDEGEDET